MGLRPRRKHVVAEGDHGPFIESKRARTRSKVLENQHKNMVHGSTERGERER
jgi:hypothetical protein